MDAEFLKITKERFIEDASPVLFMDKVANSCYGLIIYNNHSYRFAWHSDLIDPVILQIDANIFGVGIDQNFAIVDFKNMLVSLYLSLTTNFINTYLFNEWIFIVTELEVIKVMKNNYQHVKTYALPEFFAEIQFRNDKAVIICIEGTIIDIPVLRSM